MAFVPSDKAVTGIGCPGRDASFREMTFRSPPGKVIPAAYRQFSEVAQFSELSAVIHKRWQMGTATGQWEPQEFQPQ
jgi:hypothetical protein